MNTRIIRRILRPICRMWSYLYTPHVNQKVKYIFDLMHTLWFERFFNKCSGIIERGSYIRGEKYMTVSTGARICKGARLETFDSYLGSTYKPEIFIGENCRIGHGTHITAINKVYIGNDTNIGDRCLISDNNHGNFSKTSYTFNNDPNIPDVFLLVEMKRPLHCKGPVIIEEGCQIGEGSVVLTGVHIGHHSIVASNSFVRENIPPYSIVGGNPAKIIRTFSAQ